MYENLPWRKLKKSSLPGKLDCIIENTSYCREILSPVYVNLFPNASKKLFFGFTLNCRFLLFFAAT